MIEGVNPNVLELCEYDAFFGNDKVYGGAGDDVLGGGPDDDLLVGEQGDDLVRGDSGIDACSGERRQGCERPAVGKDVVR